MKLKGILNGFQCEKCKTIYSNIKDALECENQSMEEPIVKIGDIFNDEYEDTQFKIRISKILYDKHELCYSYEMYQDNKWINASTYYGNEMLLEQLGDQIDVQME